MITATRWDVMRTKALSESDEVLSLMTRFLAHRKPGDLCRLIAETDGSLRDALRKLRPVVLALEWGSDPAPGSVWS